MTILPIKKVSKESKEIENRNQDNSHINTSSHIIHSHYLPTHIQHQENRNIIARSRGYISSTSPNSYIEENIPSTSLENSTSNDGLQINKRKVKKSPNRINRKHKNNKINKNSNQNLEDISEYNSGDEYDHPNVIIDPEKLKEMERLFEKSLEEEKGYKIKKMSEDGACLFRAVADQVYGDQEMHGIIRKHCMDYMLKNGDYYSQFITENFDKYITRKSKDNSHGNHLEIQAMAEMYNRPMEVYEYCLEPINIFHGYNESTNEPIRLSYHKNSHYNSIIDPFKATIGVGLGFPLHIPGAADQNLLLDGFRASEALQIEEAMLKDKIAATDWEATNQIIEEQVARESYLQWLKDTGRAPFHHHSITELKKLSSKALNQFHNNTMTLVADNHKEGLKGETVMENGKKLENLDKLDKSDKVDISSHNIAVNDDIFVHHRDKEDSLSTSSASVSSGHSYTNQELYKKQIRCPPLRLNLSVTINNPMITPNPYPIPITTWTKTKPIPL
ncbi:uncharacterized protein LOC135923397 isoform X2 [Gordionus sp. m RMFG-2023]|uniref:uncharacterized protein LOC135923397 isoform X2 n=1 Tax=Gordionus sp. m RMFG-2023 TaxID=3053472 RepID=UPI0031FC1EF7